MQSERDNRRPLRFWRRVSLRRQMLYGFAAPIVVVLLASLFLLHALDTLGRSAKVNVESTESIGMYQELLNSVLDSETGFRGYQLTGDPEFLQPYASGLRNFEQISNRLNAAEAGDDADLRSLQQIQALFDRWLHEFAEPQIVLRRNAPVGEANHLHLLARAVGAPTGEAGEPGALMHLRAYDRLLEWLDASLEVMVPGPRADELKAALLLAAKPRPSSPGAAVARAQLVATLQTLADKSQVDEDRISSTIASKRGKKLTDAIRVGIRALLAQQMIERNTASTAATTDMNHAIWVALGVPVFALLIGLTLILLLLVDAIRAINTTRKAATAVAGGDLQKRLDVLRRDEIGELGNAFNRMADELADRNRRSIAIDRFQTQLITSNSMDEIYDVVARICTDMFTGASGAIYRIAASRNVAERVAQWNWKDSASGRVIHPDDCRAMRSGKAYFSGDAALEVPCRHIQQLDTGVGTGVARCQCMPLAAQGEIFGILLLCRFAGNVHGEATARDRETALLISEQLSMSLANMRLREQLRNQSIRDPLTDLFNRRYLEETMERELARVARNGLPMAIVAIDVDHFKEFNNAHGHEAGDKVLVELSGVLRGGIRSTDIACRYGGEEFVLLMPESSVEIAVERVEALRRRTSELRVRVGDVQLQPITISSGIAIAPLHGESSEALLRNADTALYAAKAAGRNRVTVYHSD